MSETEAETTPEPENERQEDTETADVTEQMGRQAATQIRPSTLLAMIRSTTRYRLSALALACLLGLVLASFHWSGIVAGGALVGILATSLRRAVLFGLGFGLFVVVAWILLLVATVDTANVVAMNELALLPVAMALLLAVLGSLLRGAVA